MVLAFAGDSTMTKVSAMDRPSSPLGFKVKSIGEKKSFVLAYASM
jgi:hypothetical protein